MAARYDSWGGFKECLEIRKGHIRGLKEELCGPLTQAGPKDPMWLCRGGGGVACWGCFQGENMFLLPEGARLAESSTPAAFTADLGSTLDTGGPVILEGRPALFWR